MTTPLKSELKEFSVVYTDRALNLMSAPFKTVMCDISAILKRAYKAASVIIVPGSGTFAMEAVARQFATGKSVVVIRNGFFSFRWSDIFAVCSIPSEETVILAKAVDGDAKPQFAPPSIEEVVKTILEKKPAVVFAAHVETATGIILSDEYIKAVAKAVHDVGGVFVLDCIASGNVWVNMEDTGVDVLISAPQKGWSGPACAGFAMLSKRARELIENTQSTSFAVNLRKWLEVMEKYEAGGFMYYTTLPTDALSVVRNVLVEAEAYGFEKLEKETWDLGNKVRAVLDGEGFKSVAASQCMSPGVVVCYADTPTIAAKFGENGIQIAGGVPFKLGEPEGLMTFRIGLFGLDKLKDVDATVATFEEALKKVKSSL